MDLDLEAYHQHYLENFQTHESGFEDDEVVHTWLPKVYNNFVRFLTFPLKKVLGRIGMQKKGTLHTLRLPPPSPSLRDIPDLLDNEEYNISLKTVYAVVDGRFELKLLFVLSVPPPDRIGDPQYPPTNKLYFDNLGEAQEMARFYLDIQRKMEAMKIAIDFDNYTAPILELYHHYGRKWVKDACEGYLLECFNLLIQPDPRYIKRVIDKCPMPLTITEIALAGLILQELTTERVLQFRRIPKIRDSLNRTARRPGLTHEETKWLYAGRILFVTAVILAIDWEDDYSMKLKDIVFDGLHLSPILFHTAKPWVLKVLDWNLFRFERDGRIHLAANLITAREAHLQAASTLTQLHPPEPVLANIWGEPVGFS